MKKFKVKVPATTANLGPGFDCLGLALQMYNEFAFEQSEKFEFVNFQDKYANENNLVVKSAKHVYQSKKVPVIPFKVKIKDTFSFLPRALLNNVFTILFHYLLPSFQATS